jgi:hypothetical protein
MVHTPSEHDEALERQLSRPTEKAGQHPRGGDEEEGGVPRQSGEEEISVPANSERSKEDEDRWIVKWEGRDDPGDPLNTPGWKKW